LKLKVHTQILIAIVLGVAVGILFGEKPFTIRRNCTNTDESRRKNDVTLSVFR